VKNHRRRLYYKLDITSEREVFLLFMRALMPDIPPVRAATES
jgi:DNA-binding CsgD family transcriptional regulator